MAEFDQAHASGIAEVAPIARSIITNQPYDYFESRSDARAHGAAEGVDLRRLSKTGLGYTRLPRVYSPGLERSLNTAFELLEGQDSQLFLHSDRYAVTLGQTPQGRGPDQEIDLVIPASGRSCALRLRSCDFAQLIPLPKEKDHPVKSPDAQSPLELPLGRNVLVADSDPEDFSRAIRDSFRDWERVLVVGADAVRRYLGISFNERPAGDTDKQHAARIGRVGVVLALEKALGVDAELQYAAARVERNEKI